LGNGDKIFKQKISSSIFRIKKRQPASCSSWLILILAEASFFMLLFSLDYTGGFLLVWFYLDGLIALDIANIDKGKAFIS